MESWEFLLQKEGSRSWLPLKTPSVEIAEGRYRALARTSTANTNVEIRITHQSTGEVPPKRRTQKRQRRTNDNGLIVVIPFTYLKPGIWELHCSVDVASDLFSHLLSDIWQQSIQLQVKPALNSEISLVPPVPSDELLGEILQPPDASPKAELVNPPPEPPPARDEEPASLNLPLVEVVETPQNFEPLPPTPNPPLAPQIHKPTSTSARIASKSPQLPKLPKPQQPLQLEAEDILKSDTLPAANSQPSKDAAAEVPLDSPTEIQPAQPEASKPADPDDNFQSLRVQERFLTRLQELVEEDLSEEPKTDLLSLNIAANPEKAAPPNSAEVAIDYRDWLIEPDPASSGIEPLELYIEPSSTSSPLPAETDAPTNPATQAFAAPLVEGNANYSPLQEPPIPSLMHLPDPVPIPELIVPPGELIAGESVSVCVKLPADSASMYVKLWVKDRQTRSLVDGPRYIMDFSPSGSGTMDAMTQLIVPLGCLEIWFEAVAIDSHRHRESYKATIERVVVPPNLPRLWRYGSEA
jgi:hypothetical protein